MATFDQHVALVTGGNYLVDGGYTAREKLHTAHHVEGNGQGKAENQDAGEEDDSTELGNLKGQSQEALTRAQHS